MLVLTLSGCRIGFDELFPGAVPGDPADAAVADPDSGGEDMLGPFGMPTRHVALGSTANDKHPSLTADLLEIYFDTGRACGGCFEVYMATRASLTSAWSTPVEVPSLASNSFDYTPEVSPDGLTLWFASERDNPSGGSDIWVATRTARTQPWGTPVRETSLSTSGYDSAPSLSDDGLTMTITSDGAGGQAADIYVATRATTTSPWSTPVPLSELNTGMLDSAGPIRDGGRQIFFDRETAPNQFDIYFATRATTGALFGSAAVVESINDDTARDIDAWVSADLRTIFFASARTGNLEIYEATR